MPLTPKTSQNMKHYYFTYPVLIIIIVKSKLVVSISVILCIMMTGGACELKVNVDIN